MFLAALRIRPGESRYGSGVRLAKLSIIAGQHLSGSVGGTLPWPEQESLQSILSLPALGVGLGKSGKDIDRSNLVPLVQPEVVMPVNYDEPLEVFAFNCTHRGVASNKPCLWNAYSSYASDVVAVSVERTLGASGLLGC